MTEMILESQVRARLLRFIWAKLRILEFGGYRWNDDIKEPNRINSIVMVKIDTFRIIAKEKHEGLWKEFNIEIGEKEEQRTIVKLQTLLIR